jgi:hypothetical protein
LQIFGKYAEYLLSSALIHFKMLHGTFPQRPILHFATMITPLELGISSGIFNYHGSKVNLKWRGSIPGKGKDDMKSFIERVCAETAVKNGYRDCTIRYVLDLPYRVCSLEYEFLFP